MDWLRQDLRFATRTLARSPGFALTAIIALALGIGANTAIFSMADALILRPAPFLGADRLVVFWEENLAQGARYNEVAPAQFRAVAERSRSFEQLAAYDFGGATLTGSGEPERLTGLVIDANLLPLLGVQPALGRAFTPEEDAEGAAPVALISHGLWTRRFGNDRGILGRSIELNGTPTTVVGVMPRSFAFAIAADVWRPLALSASRWEETHHWLRTVGRLRPGVSLSEARAELQAIAAAAERERPRTSTGWTFSLHPLNEGLVQGPIKPLVMVMFGAVGFVLLIACADVANLLLARASGRSREVAIRTALGARRGRLVRQLLTESLLLALGGATAGVLIASWSLDLVRSIIPAAVLEFSPRMASLGVDTRVLVFTITIALATGLIFGLVPALRASRPDLARSLRDGDRSATAARGGHRLRSALVAAQVALALVLLAGGTLMMRSFRAQLNANPGFRSDDMLTMWVSPRAAAYEGSERVLGFHMAITERIAALPAVEDVALTNAFPLSGENWRPPFDIEGRPMSPGSERPSANTRLVAPNYLRMLGLPIRAGRDFEPADRSGAQPVAIVSENFARRFFPGEDAIGNRIRVDGDSAREIVGIVADVQDWRLGTTSMATLYVPLMQFPARTVAIVARTRRDAPDAAAAIRRAVYAVDEGQPVYDVRTMREVLDEAIFAQRLGSALMAVFAFIALLLAVVGVYGVMAYAVSQRTHELGIRMALGARAADVTRQVLARGMRPVAAGIAFGLLGAYALRRALERILWEPGQAQSLSIIGAALALALAALVATAVPAWRATRVDLLSALREGVEGRG